MGSRVKGKCNPGFSNVTPEVTNGFKRNPDVAIFRAHALNPKSGLGNNSDITEKPFGEGLVAIGCRLLVRARFQGVF